MRDIIKIYLGDAVVLLIKLYIGFKYFIETKILLGDFNKRELVFKKVNFSFFDLLGKVLTFRS